MTVTASHGTSETELGAIAGRSRDEERQTFRYRAIDDRTEVRDGELRAASETDAVARIRQLGLRPVSIKVARYRSLQREYTLPAIGPRVKGAELAVVARQLATMVDAGVPLLRSLEVLQRQTENTVLAKTIKQVSLDIESGDSLSQAIGRHPKVFDHLFVSMVRSGEAAGALDIVLLQLATTLERKVAMSQKIRSALSYPLAVLVMVVGVVVAMLVIVVPTFAGIYDDLGGTLPLPTRLLITASELMTSRLPI
ncbi:MAG: type II secretion system F family protein, partial [Actinomycetota bacterium]